MAKEVELITQYKQQAAERATEFVESGMMVGLGTGSTAIFATRRMGQLLQTGRLKNIFGFATSKAVWKEAERLGIHMMSEEMPDSLDLTIDGADEIDPQLNLIKGKGGALLREKIAAQASRRVIIVADDSKLSPVLGAKQALPVEVMPFGWRSQYGYLQTLGARVEVRYHADGSLFETDSGNIILDCNFGPITNAVELAAKLSTRAGIVEHGLFLGLATDLVVAGKNGIAILNTQKHSEVRREEAR